MMAHVIWECFSVSLLVQLATWSLDRIAEQGLADMLHVDIHIIATSDPDMDPIKSLSDEAIAIRVLD